MAARALVVVAAVVALGVGPFTPVAAHATEPAADLSITVGNYASAKTGEGTSFVLDVKNDGPDAAANVVVAISFDGSFLVPGVHDGCAVAGDRRSVICSLGDVPSGQDRLQVVTLTPRTTGSYVLPVVMSSDTADPDTADRATSASIIVLPGPSQGVRYVKGEFGQMVFSPPTTSTVAYWAKRWDAMAPQGRGLDSIPYTWLTSSQKRRWQVRDQYLAILGRRSSSADEAFWVGRMVSGMSYESFQLALLTSHEFYARWHSQVCHPAYYAVLKRQATADECKVFADSLRAGESLAMVMRSLQRSVENYTRIIDFEYQATVEHPPSNAGRYFAMLDLMRGRVSPERQEARLDVSPEVLARYPYTSPT